MDSFSSSSSDTQMRPLFREINFPTPSAEPCDNHPQSGPAAGTIRIKGRSGMDWMERKEQWINIQLFHCAQGFSANWNGTEWDEMMTWGGGEGVQLLCSCRWRMMLMKLRVLLLMAGVIRNNKRTTTTASQPAAIMRGEERFNGLHRDEREEGRKSRKTHRFILKPPPSRAKRWKCLFVENSQAAAFSSSSPSIVYFVWWIG